MEPGVDLLMQLHLLPTGKVEAVRPRIGLHFSKEPPTRVSYVALLWEYDIDIPAGDLKYEVEERFRISVDVQALGLFPHAHYLGKDFRIFAELPNGEHRWLLRIDDWDFNWQSDYNFEKPIDIPAGSELVMQLSYDNSADNFRNPSDPPRRVRAGWGSFDEMGEVAIQLLLNDGEDLPKLEEATARYELKRPETAVQGWYNVAVALTDQGRTTEAIEAYEECLYLEPKYGRALNNLGAIYEERGRDALSLRFYEQTLAADPVQQEAYLNLARAYARANRAADSIETLEKLLSVNELHIAARRMLGLMYLRSGDAVASASILEQGLQWYGEDPVYLLDLVDAYSMAGRLGEAYSLAMRALEVSPHSTDVHIALASLSYEMGNRDEAQRRLAYLFVLDSEDRPSIEEVVGSLPFPEGVVDVVEQLENRGDASGAARLLEQAITYAKASGLKDEVALLQGVKRSLGL